MSVGEQISNWKQARMQLLVVTQPATVCTGTREGFVTYLGKALLPL